MKSSHISSLSLSLLALCLQTSMASKASHSHHRDIRDLHTYPNTLEPYGYTQVPEPVYKHSRSHSAVRLDHATPPNLYAPDTPDSYVIHADVVNYKPTPIYEPPVTSTYTSSKSPSDTCLTTSTIGTYEETTSKPEYSIAVYIGVDPPSTYAPSLSESTSYTDANSLHMPVPYSQQPSYDPDTSPYTPQSQTDMPTTTSSSSTYHRHFVQPTSYSLKAAISSTATAIPEIEYDSNVKKDICTWDGVQIDDKEIATPVLSYSYSDRPSKPPHPGLIDKDILAMVGSLSLKQKIGQMTMIEVGQLIDCNGELNTTAVKYWIEEWGVGSFLETPGNHGGKYRLYSAKRFSQFTDSVQQIAVNSGPKIPVVWGLDSVRGSNYVAGAVIFPVGIATAATFNPSFAYDAGRIAAKDSRAAGVHWAFAPISDLTVNKLWSRVYENFGEDPLLSSRMTTASIGGYQGDYKHDRTRVAACMKHFIGYGYPFDGKDRSNRHIATHDLLEYYVPSFKAAIDAGVATGMESYGVIDGVPVVMSHYYLQTLLREQLGFKGMLVTDWGEINSQASTYFTARDTEQATWATINRTSVDMSMVAEDESFGKNMLDLVANGYISESRVDESVARILQLKKDLGLFEQPFANPELAATVGSAQDVKAARDAVRESITLLKNSNCVLPLKPSDRVLFVGPTLNSTRYLGGGWNVHWQGPSDEEGDSVYQGFGDTILKGVREVTGTDPVYFEGTDIDGSELIDIDAIVAAAKTADKIVIGLGEHTYAEIAGDIDELHLPQNHLDLVYSIAAGAEKPIVVVLVEGRPRILDHVADIADAIVTAYLPGTYGGLPVAEVLYGKVNPSGRLPYTYPATEAQASTTIWQPSFSDYNPQWAFGYGLGYSEIVYSNITVSSTDLRVGQPIAVSVSITNRGPYAQKESVLLFTNQEYRFDMAPEHLRLRDFAKIDLAVGETQQVSFELHAEQLAFWDSENKRRIEPSPLNISINPYTQQNIIAQVMLDANPDNLVASF